MPSPLIFGRRVALPSCDCSGVDLQAPMPLLPYWLRDKLPKLRGEALGFVHSAVVRGWRARYDSCRYRSCHVLQVIGLAETRWSGWESIPFIRSVFLCFRRLAGVDSSMPWPPLANLPVRLRPSSKLTAVCGCRAIGAAVQPLGSHVGVISPICVFSSCIFWARKWAQTGHRHFCGLERMGRVP